jgi:predicted nucleic acid-binding protein
LTTFLDTSAILALFDADDPRHGDVDGHFAEHGFTLIPG